MKIKIFCLLLVSFLLSSCGTKLDDVKAADIIKESFELTADDTVEILGISEESEDIVIVKFKLNEVQISSRMRKYDKGWQLDEIQNDFGMWVPAENLTSSFSNHERQMNTMKEITAIATAIIDHVTDNGIAPAQDGIFDESSTFYSALVPYYIKSLPTKDKWGNDYLVYCGQACDGKYGISDPSADEFVIVSKGKDGELDAWSYDPSDPASAFYKIESQEDFNNDLIMWNGNWIRAPKSE